jgi:hypothetical protein
LCGEAPPSGLDRFLRTVGIRRNAEAILGNLAPDARAALIFPRRPQRNAIPYEV